MRGALDWRATAVGGVPVRSGLGGARSRDRGRRGRRTRRPRLSAIVGAKRFPSMVAAGFPAAVVAEMCTLIEEDGVVPAMVEALAATARPHQWAAAVAATLLALSGASGALPSAKIAA